MLVITRRHQEAIVIGHGIEVRVLRVGRDTVRLGVTAPLDVPVHRTEIYEQICEENRAAAADAGAPVVLTGRLRRTASNTPRQGRRS